MRDSSVSFIVMVIGGLLVAGIGVYQAEITSIVLGAILCFIGAFALLRFSRGESEEEIE